MFENIKNILIAILTLAIFFGIIVTVLYFWFSPEFLIRSLQGLGLMGGIFLFGKLYTLYQRARKSGVISDKLSQKISDISEISLGLVLVLPLVIGIICLILWIFGVIK